MIIGTAEITLHASWIGSLKEKRMLAKSLIAQVRHKFNVSVAEVGAQDTHQTLIIGIAWVTGSVRQSDSILEQVLRFVENNTEAEIQDIQHEIR
jgi:uncharacterized protein YlxP (DUF503 family)